MSQAKTKSKTPDDLSSVTWADFSEWKSSDFDFDYDLFVMHQPGYIMHNMIGASFNAEGKAFKLMLGYNVIGHQLMIWSHKCAETANEFFSHEVIDLGKVDLMTQPVITRKQNGLFFVSERPVYAGEQFYYVSSDPVMPALMKAFILRFPETDNVYAWEEAVNFSNSLKRRINKLKSSLNFTKDGEQTYMASSRE
jgi:hypothetical protein